LIESWFILLLPMTRGCGGMGPMEGCLAKASLIGGGGGGGLMINSLIRSMISSGSLGIRRYMGSTS